MSAHKALPQATLQTYPEGSMRYNVAKLLVEHKRVTQEFLLARLDATPRAVRGTLRDLQLAHLAECSANDERWQLTSEGMVYWTGQHLVDAARRLAANTPEPVKLRPIDQCTSLMTRSMTRMPSPADRLPMVYRDGAMDFKKCARINGPWRVFPDGSREPQDAKPGVL